MATFDELSELEDLRLFVQERVQEADASIDTDIGSSFDVEVIQPLLTRLGPDPYNAPLRQFILARLRTEFPDLVIQDGEPLDDYAVKIMQILLEPFRRQIQQVSNNQSLANPSTLNESEADNLAANFFATRRLGGYSVGVARVYYPSPQYVLITPSNAVSTSSGLRYYPVRNQAITVDNMLYNEENNLFYFDVVVRAEQQGTEYDIDPNQLVAIDGVAGAVKVTNKASFDEGGNKEDTETFISRVQEGLTEKALVTPKGINARLTEVFESVRLIQVIGFGDPEMERDILEGSGESTPYAFASIVMDGTSTILLDTGSPSPIVDTLGTTHAFFSGVSVLVGDLVEFADHATGLWKSLTVTDVLSTTSLKLSGPAVHVGTLPVTLRRAEGGIRISDIPGGILQPITENGIISISDGQVHIGGVFDVFVRAATVQERDITLEGILDAAPLHFGVDLEAYGSADDRFVHLTERINHSAFIPGTDRFGNVETHHVLVSEEIMEKVVWGAGETDVNRYLQLLGGGGANWGTFKINEYLGRELYPDSGGFLRPVARLVLDSYDQETRTTVTPLATNTNFDAHVRVVEKMSAKSWVRDRDASNDAVPADAFGPVIPGGVDFINDVGAEVGDSVVIETGDDAGIYSIRRRLSWLSDNDTLVLDRELTKSLPPSGVGDGSGLRYRIADELDVDLISPRVTKIPLGNIFEGTDLNAVASSRTVTSGGLTNFLLAGVSEGDTLEVLEGDNQGTYRIITVAGTSLVVDIAMQATGTSLSFSVYKAFTGIDRPLVRVKEIELLDSNSQPTGIKIPFGDSIDARINGTLSNRAEGTAVESVTGALTSDAGYTQLTDPNTNFVAAEVATGFRLNLRTGNSVGEYEIDALGPEWGGTVNDLRVKPVSEGGTAWTEAESPVTYSIGLPSSGIARLFFLEPTSIELQTGLDGGRLSDPATGREFRFSEVDGYQKFPATGTTAENPRDLKVVRENFLPMVLTGDQNDGRAELFSVWSRFQDLNATFQTDGVAMGDVLEILEGSYIGKHVISLVLDEQTIFIPVGVFTALETGLDYQILSQKTAETILEVTDVDTPGVFDMELQEGDIVKVNEQLPFRTASGQTLREVGIFGAAAGLRTVAGSNQVKVPSSSFIDFVKMNTYFPLAGSRLQIESGPDAGAYLVEEVVDSKTLKINQVMTSSTDVVLGEGSVSQAYTGLNGDDTDGAAWFADSVVDIRTVVEPGDIIVLKNNGGAFPGDYYMHGVLRLDTANPRVELAGMPPYGYDSGSGIEYFVLRKRDSFLNAVDSGKSKITDETSGAQFGDVQGHYITLYESARGHVDGTFEIGDLLAAEPKSVELSGVVFDNAPSERPDSGDGVGDLSMSGSDALLTDAAADYVNDGVKSGDTLHITSGTYAGKRYPIHGVAATVLSIYSAAALSETDVDYKVEAASSSDPLGLGRFGWVRTELNANVEQPFRLYQSVPTQLTILEVATKREDVVGVQRGDLTSTTTLEDPSGFDFAAAGVKRGDLLEILSGSSEGVYSIASDPGASVVTIQSSKPFTGGTTSDVPYRVWGGLHGSRRMLTVGSYAGNSGRVEPGVGMPYRILRPKITRVSSTEMQDYFDGALYYVDVQIESLGAGDDLNLVDGTKLTIDSGLRADGYKYTVGNNKLTFSMFEEISLTFDRRFLPVGNSDSPENLTEISGRNLKVVFETSSTVRLVNDLLRSDQERPINANPMARHFLPSFVYTTFEYEGGSGASETGQEMEDYINTLGAEDELEVSDLEAFLTRRGATSIRHPILLVTVTHDLDRNLVVDRSLDRLGGSNDVPYNGTGRISSFFADLEAGLTVERE